MTTLAGLISGTAKVSLDTAHVFDTVQHIYGLCAGAGVVVPSEILAAIYQDDDAHDTCTLTACLNPLHPGPCKGWKHSLFQTAPNAWHALEAARVEKANKRRLEKIEALKAAGKPIPKKLLVPIVAKPHPHPGQTAKAAAGEAHAAGEAVTKAAGVHVNAPGKVMLGQATKTLGQTVEKGPKGKKPTLASKGIAFVIAQEKVTPQYKLDKAAAITPEQWAALSHDDKAVIRGELLKIQKDGFGPQQKKATELLDKLAEPKSEPKIGELKPGTPGTITAPSGKVYQKINLPTPEAKPESSTGAKQSIEKAADDAAKAKIDKLIDAINMAKAAEPKAATPEVAPHHVPKFPGEPLSAKNYTPAMADATKMAQSFVDPPKMHSLQTSFATRFKAYQKINAEEWKALPEGTKTAIVHDVVGVAAADPQLHQGFIGEDGKAYTPASAWLKRRNIELPPLEQGKIDKWVPQFAKDKPVKPTPVVGITEKTSVKGHNVFGEYTKIDKVEHPKYEVPTKPTLGEDKAALAKVVEAQANAGPPKVTKLSEVATPNTAVTTGGKIENVAEKAPGLAKKDLPAHVQHAIDMAKGTAPGASWSKNHLAAYQELKPEEFKALDADVQSKILGELEKGKGKFLDPKKVKASDDLIAKFKSATGKIDHGIEAPKPPTAIKPDEMTPAQVKSKAVDLLGPEAVKLHVQPNFSEMQANMAQGKKDAAAEVAKHGPEVANDPSLAAKKLGMETAFAKVHNAQTAQNKFMAHMQQHHIAATTGGKSPVTGELLTPEDKVVLGKHSIDMFNAFGGGAHLKQAKDDLEQAKATFHAAANNLTKAKAEGPPKVELSEFDQKTVKNAFSNAWGKHASKAVTFGVKYQHSQKMKANPEYEKLTQDLGNLKSLAGQVALAHAEENAAKLNAPLHPDTGVIEPGTPEAKAYAAAISKRAQLEQEFNALHKQAQARLDTIRTEAGLKKRTLPKLDTAAVKAAAAESGYYQSSGYGGPNYGKHTSAKSYMLAKVGDNLGIKHQTASEKADEKAAAQIAKMSEDVKKSGGSVSPTGKYVPPPTTQKTKDQFPSATEAGTTPSLESAQKYGFHYEQKYAPPVHGWPGDAGGAYVTANSEHLEAAKKILSSPDLKTGLEAQTQFKWSINNMDGKGAPAGSKGSLYNYTGSGYDAVNSKLNSLPPGAKKTGSTSISNIDKGMEASPAPEQDLILYRGFKDPHGVFSSGKWNDVNVAGMEWSQRSYSSTSGQLSTAQSFAGYSGVVMRVIVPKEMQVKGINAKGGQHPGEAEIILQRGLRYRVVADHGKHGNTRYIDVMVVPNPYAKAE